MNSSTFMALDEMIKKNWVTDDLSEFNKVLNEYVREKRISTEEYRSLIELYIATLRTDKQH
jgi:hypothetical protein